MFSGSVIARNRAVLAAVIVVLVLGIFAVFGGKALMTLLVLALAAMVPIGLAAIGEIINERAGLVNIGIEGIIVVSALVAVISAEAAQDPYLGLVGAALAGGLMAAVFGWVTTYGHGSQVIAGVGLNLVALGAVALTLVLQWNTPGFHMLLNDALRPARIQTGAGVISWLCIATFVLAAVTWFLLENTRFGLRLKAAGNNPFVTDAMGLDVYRLRLLACTMGGVFAGLAGGYLALDYLGGVTRDVAQGRGFIALACLVFGALDIPLVLGIAFVFGLSEALALWLQNVTWAKDFVINGGGFFLLMIPYLAVVVALALFPGFERLSNMIGATYWRGR